MKTCKKCKNDFEQNSNSQKYCYGCLSKKCEWCGRLFVSKNRHINQKFCSEKCKVDTQIGKPAAPNLLGKRGIKPRTYHLRKRDKHGGVEDKEWRTKVFKRDNWTCQECFKRGGRLQAHHITPYKENTELRHDINNGKTLCVECHSKTETYGWSKYWHKKRIEAERRQLKLF